MFFTDIPSPVGMLRLASDGTAITGLWLENQKYFAAGLASNAEKAQGLPVFQETASWLDIYFSGGLPPALPPIAPLGSKFRQAVWKLLLEIPYGKTSTYGALAEQLHSSPRAIGGAVGHNPISILIPCHRVLGSGGSLTGYAGGTEIKRYLLELEQKGLTIPVSFSKFPCPCCGYKTFPVPKEDAVAYICPVCFWENDVFTPGDNQPSDENHGMTLNQGREAFRRLGAVRSDLVQYVRPPRPDELP